MVNGHALHLALDPEPATTPAEPGAAAPILVDVDVGDAMVAAASWICRSMCEYQAAGRLTIQTRTTGGERVVPLAMAMLEHTGSDDVFLTKARAAGRAGLRRHLESDFPPPCSPAEIDRVIEIALDGTLEIVTKAVEAERLHRAAHAN